MLQLIAWSLAVGAFAAVVQIMSKMKVWWN